MGVLSGSDTLSNRGQIVSSQSWGVRALKAGGNTVINSGLIRGLLDPTNTATTGAISFTGSENTLTLNPGSVLIGLVKLGDATTVNINTTRPVILYVDDVANGTFNSTTHSTIYVDAANNRVIAYNPSALRSTGGGMTVKLVGDGVSSVLFGGAAATTVVTAASGDGSARQAAMDAPQVSMLAGGFATRGKSKSPALWSTAFGGLMALRFHPAPGLLIGLHGGAARTKVEGNKGKSGGFGGVHARFENEGFHLAGVLTAGRAGTGGGSVTFLDNFSPTGFTTFTLRGGKVTFISAEGRLGVTFAVPEAPMVTLTPALMARVTRMKTKGGSISGLPISGGDKSTMFDGRAQITAAFDVSTMPEQQARLLVTSGVALHDEKGGANDRVTGFGALKLQVRTAEGISFFAGGEGHVGKGGIVGLAGSAGFNLRF